MVKKTSTADPEFTKLFREKVRNEVKELRAIIKEVFSEAEVTTYTETYRGMFTLKIPDAVVALDENRQNGGLAAITVKVPTTIEPKFVLAKLGDLGYKKFEHCADYSTEIKGYYMYIAHITEERGKFRSLKD